MSEPKQLSKEELKTVMELREQRQGVFDEYYVLNKIANPTAAQERLMTSYKNLMISLDSRLQLLTGVKQDWKKLTYKP